jgi:hypothetical protein
MAASHAECLELVQLAARQDRLLAVYQNRRCEAAAAAAVEAALNCTCNSVLKVLNCGWWVVCSAGLLSCCYRASQGRPELGPGWQLLRSMLQCAARKTCGTAATDTRVVPIWLRQLPKQCLRQCQACAACM